MKARTACHVRPPWESDDAPSTWLLISPGGKWLGSVMLRPELQRVRIAPDALTGSRRALPALLLLLLLAAAGCGGTEEEGPAPAQAAVHADSAGITVSLIPEGAWPEAVRLDEPEVLIGEDESRPGHTLHRTRGVRELPDGQVVLLDGGSSEIRVFDPEGELLHRFGRAGDGPEELRLPSGTARLHGDSIGVTTGRGEVRVFARDGSFGRGGWVDRTPTAQEASHLPGERGLTLHGILQGGRSVGSRLHPSEEDPDGLIRDTLEVALHEADGARARVLGRFGAAERVDGERHLAGDAVIREPFPFARPALVAVEGRRAVVGLSDRFELRVFGEEGELRRVVRVARDPVPVTDAVMRRYVDLAAGRMQVEDGRTAPGSLDEEMRRRYRENRMQLPRVASLPHFDQLLLGEAGSIWIRDHVFPYSNPERVRWREITPEGEAGRAVDLPADFRFMYASPSRLLGVLPGELGVERVIRFPLPDREPSPRGPRP